MNEAVYFMRQVNEFIASNPEHPVVVDYNKGNIGLGFIIRNWQEIHNETYSNQRQGSSRQDNPSPSNS